LKRYSSISEFYAIHKQLQKECTGPTAHAMYPLLWLIESAYFDKPLSHAALLVDAPWFEAHSERVCRVREAMHEEINPKTSERYDSIFVMSLRPDLLLRTPVKGTSYVGNSEPELLHLMNSSIHEVTFDHSRSIDVYRTRSHSPSIKR